MDLIKNKATMENKQQILEFAKRLYNIPYPNVDDVECASFMMEVMLDVDEIAKKCIEFVKNPSL